jgi:hypothetical protein
MREAARDAAAPSRFLDQNSCILVIGMTTFPMVRVPWVASENVRVIELAELTLWTPYDPSGLVNCGPPAYRSQLPVYEVGDVREPVARYHTGLPASSYT